MDPEREDYADPPGGPPALRELTWAVALFLAPALVAILMALWCVLGFLN